VVVTGARGPVGRAVVETLLWLGHTVYAISRRPEHVGLRAAATVVAGDFAEPPSLDAAFDAAASLVLVALPDTAVEVLALARNAGSDRSSWSPPRR
jgi:uncharacterized protein YbjT (DUF2867 family)